MKIDGKFKSMFQVVTIIFVAMIFIMSGAYAQAISPNPESAVAHGIFILKLLVGLAISAGVGFLTEEE